MRKLAIDTNVVLTWLGLQSEKLLLKSKELFDGMAGGKLNLASPEFLLIELANVLKWRFNQDEARVEEVIKLVMRSGIKFVPVGKRVTRDVVKLIFKHNLTAYDALFLLVATKEKCKLVTTDPKLLEVKKWCVELGKLDL